MKDPRVRGAARLMIDDWLSEMQAPCVPDMLRQPATQGALKARGSWRDRRRPHKATLPRRRLLLPNGQREAADVMLRISHVLPRTPQWLDTLNV